MVRFASFLSGGFITAIVLNPPEKKLTKHTSVHCLITPICKAHYFLKIVPNLTPMVFVADMLKYTFDQCCTFLGLNAQPEIQILN